MHTLVRRSVAAAFATTLLVASAVSTAAASPQGYDEEDHLAGRFYGNFELGVLLFTGDEVVNYCTGAPEPVVEARVFHREDGGAELMANSTGMPIFLYRSSLGAPEFIDATCGALFDADPATVPVPPFASGTATFKERITISAAGVREDSNSVNGIATGDGVSWKVRTWADFVLGDDGVPVGDPADFQGLSIHQIGS